MEDNRTPEQRQEDNLSRMQPMYPIHVVPHEVNHAAHDTPAAAPLADPTLGPIQGTAWNSGRRRWLWAVLLLPMLCSLSMLVYVIVPPPQANVLLLGLDARPNEGFATRTDAIMVMGIRPRLLRVSLLSVPRDLFFEVPGYGVQRINTVNVLGELDETGTGPLLVGDAVSATLNIDVDYYLRVNFEGFVRLVDALGGVTIDVPKAIVDYQYPTPDGGVKTIRFDPGRQVMSGEEALIYARTRHADDDYARAGRQQQVVNAVSQKLLSPLNWGRALSVIGQSVDTNMAWWQMALYAPPMVFSGGRLDQRVIDRDAILPGASGAVPNVDVLQPWLSGRFD